MSTPFTPLTPQEFTDAFKPQAAICDACTPCI